MELAEVHTNFGKNLVQGGEVFRYTAFPQGGVPP